MAKINNILIVCTGNTCRSPMAEGLLKKMLGEKQDIRISSAGVLGLVGAPPSKEAIKVMLGQSIDITGHRSRALSEALIKEADLILVMERFHKDEIFRVVQGAQDKVFLLKEFGTNEKPVNPDVPDPIGKPLEVYEVVFSMIKQGIERVYKSILGFQE